LTVDIGSYSTFIVVQQLLGDEPTLARVAGCRISSYVGVLHSSSGTPGIASLDSQLLV